MRKLVLTLAALAIGLLIAPRTADATIIIPKDLKDLTLESDAIVFGEVIDQTTDYLTEESKIIVTKSTIAVKGQWKGEKTDRFTITEIGGTIGDVTCAVAGTPEYKMGERVLIFAKKMPLGCFRTHGMIQGRFAVQETKIDGDDMVRIEKGLEQVVDKYIAKDRITPGKTVLLDDMQAKVEEILAAEKKAKEAKK